MKTLQLFFLSFLFISFASIASAQQKTASFKVAGECGMCKKKIETAAKNAGASYAVWNVGTKEMVVKYDNASANPAKIQQSIAAAGYDTPTVKATEDAYNNLHECCKYERTAAAANDAKKDCCKDGKCTAQDTKDCCKDGKCTNAQAANGNEPACCKKA